MASVHNSIKLGCTRPAKAEQRLLLFYLWILIESRIYTLNQLITQSCPQPHTHTASKTSLHASFEVQTIYPVHSAHDIVNLRLRHFFFLHKMISRIHMPALVCSWLVLFFSLFFFHTYSMRARVHWIKIELFRRNGVLRKIITPNKSEIKAIKLPTFNGFTLFAFHGNCRIENTPNEFES